MGRHRISLRFFRLWMMATFGGWLLGVLVVILTGEIAGIGEYSRAGIGMGWSVGMAQRRAAKEWFGGTAEWMWASALGIGAPFLLVDAGGGLRTEEWLVVPIAAVGGLLAGAWQWRTVRARTTGANWWILASAVGWGFSAAVPFALVMPGPHVSNLVALALGGLMLGAVTGGTLVWVLAPVEAGVESSS